MITGLGAGPSFADTNNINAQANLALADLVQQVATILASKGYSATMAKTAGGVGGQYLLTDRYDAYITNIPAWAGMSYYLSVSDLSSSAGQLANAILSSFDWKSTMAGAPVLAPTSQVSAPTQTQAAAATNTTATPTSVAVIAGSGKQQELYKPAGEASGGASMTIEDIYNQWVAGTYTGAVTGVMQQQLDAMYKERHPVVVASGTPSTTSTVATTATNQAAGTGAETTIAHYTSMLQAEDIYPGVANWMIIVAAAAALWFMNKSGGR
jgi:hypothetical protein